MNRFVLIMFLGCSVVTASHAQVVPHSQQLAMTVMQTWPDSFLIGSDKSAKWRYDQGVILKGFEGIWKGTGQGKWFSYIQKSMDFYVKEDGSIKGYRPDEYNIDHINNGKALLLLYQVTGKEKYRKASELLRNQLKTHPRTNEGGFWHKKIYPYQMWLDGLYMGQPFYAEYAKLFKEDTAFNDIARQFMYMEKHARDTKTGLLYHGWDESRQQKWADKTTGLSPNFWGRAMGWYGMALVDVLDHFPEKHWGRDSLLSILGRFAKAIVPVQNEKGLWYDILDMKNNAKNYPEASASCMLAYTLAKAARKGWLPSAYLPAAIKAFDGIVSSFIKVENGTTNLHGTVAVSGLGGEPYRDGSFEYYMNEPVVVNDPKGMGAFIKCAVEIEQAKAGNRMGRGKTILLDRYFNSEKRPDTKGNPVYWHYTWEEKSNPGFYFFGHLFKKYGARVQSLDQAPSAAGLKNASVYIIVDPDHAKDKPSPNLVNAADVKVISDWVKAGGVLVLMANDSANCDLTHFNKLSSVFGISFTDKSRNMVQQDNYQQGLLIPSDKTIFKTARRLFLKEISILQTRPPARPVLSEKGDVIMAFSQFGQGTVFAVGDPWLYNEYVDGRRLPEEFDNYKAADDLVRWLLSKTKK